MSSVRPTASSAKPMAKPIISDFGNFNFIFEVLSIISGLADIALLEKKEAPLRGASPLQRRLSRSPLDSLAMFELFLSIPPFPIMEEPALLRGPLLLRSSVFHISPQGRNRTP